MHPHHLVRAPHEADERQGTIVDATIFHAPSSIKNEEGRHDPEIRRTKTGIQCFFAMKAPIGADMESDLVHHVQGTAANVADVTQVAELLHGEEIAVYEDPGHTGVEERENHKAIWQVAARNSTYSSFNKRRLLYRVERKIDIAKHRCGARLSILSGGQAAVR